MSDDKDTIEVDDDFVIEEPEEVPPVQVETAKTNLSKRRTIDNMLDERRLRRQLADYDFDF